MAPPIILKGGPAPPPPIFPYTYTTLGAVVQTLCDVFNKQASFKTMLSEVHKLVLLYLTVPVTTATAKRSFSGLKHIIVYFCIFIATKQTILTDEFIKQNENILETYHLGRHIYAIQLSIFFLLPTMFVAITYIYIFTLQIPL